MESASYLDNNTETVKITENNQQIIRNHSTLIINLKNLKSFKGATLDKCTATINEITKSFSNISGTSIDNITLDFGTLNISNNSIMTIVLTDSRGYTVTKKLDISVINYIDLSINATIKRTQPTTGEVDITFSGNYYNSKLGEVDNTLAINWFYRESGKENWINGGNIVPTISNNTFNNGSTAISLGKIFDYQKSYEFYLQVVDKLITLNPKYIVTQGIPIFNWGKDYININGELMIYDIPINGKIVYESEEGTTGDITLSEDASNFSYLEIFYKNDNNRYQSIKIDNPNEKIVSLLSTSLDNNSASNIKLKDIKISESTISVIYTQSLNFWDGSWHNHDGNNTIYINKVIGYR